LAGGIDSLESIHGLLKSLKIWGLYSSYSVCTLYVQYPCTFTIYNTQYHVRETENGRTNEAGGFKKWREDVNKRNLV
jgi:hypothetical protein